MLHFARTVMGYHGCRAEFAQRLIGGEITMDQWRPSTNDWDWLGHGIYFWEYAPERAKSWGEERPGERSVVGAIIQLGNCLDLSDVEGVELLADQYETTRETFFEQGKSLPTNRNGRSDRDCLIINDLIEATGKTFQTVRSPFLEGEAAFPGSRIRRKSHVQLVVRDPACILGIFLPTYLPKGD